MNVKPFFDQARAARENEKLHHDGNTLLKVHKILFKYLKDDISVNDAVNELQNEGILFRERLRGGDGRS